MPRRVVITGLGTVSGLGVGMSALWEGLCAGRSCLKPITRLDVSGFPCRLWGELETFSGKDYVPKNYRKAVKVMARDIQLAVATAKEAVADAKLVTRGTLEEKDEGGGSAAAVGDAGGGAATAAAPATTYRGARMGCHIGAGLIPAEDEEIAAAFATARAEGDAQRLDLAAWGKVGMDSLTPLWLLKYLPNMLSCHVTIIHGCLGPSNTITCGEASGLLSIGESLRVIERGGADLCFSGGAETKLNLMGMIRMDFAKRLAHTGGETDGARVVRPFDRASPGGLMGEGGGILILEELECARARGASVYAEIVGFGGGHSPMRSVVPDEHDESPDEGFESAIRNALDDAELGPGDVDAITLMGSGVRNIDLPEAGALKQVFGESLGNIPLVTVGPNIGNLSAGMGGVLAAVAAKCLREQRLPARVHHGTPIDGVLVGAAEARACPLRNVLVATSSVGGQNAALLLRKAPA